MPITIEGDTEHPDVTALKQRVREVAEQYAKRHNWCREVQRALAEAGIVDETRLHVQVDFHIEGADAQQTTIRIPQSDLAGKTRRQQHALVADLLSPEVTIGRVAIKVPVIIDDLNLVESGASEVKDGYVLRYTSHEGKVQHIVEEVSLRHNRHWTLAECGSSGSWVEESSRSEGRVCARCVTRHENH
jgi:stress-induced morphogen